MAKEYNMFFKIAGFIGDLAVFALSFYTLFITAISKKVKLLTFGVSSSLFYGTDISITVMNKSLHPIPVQSFFIMKRYEGKFYLMSSEERKVIIIDSWGIKRLDLGAFTSTDWPVMDDENQYPDYDAVFEDAVIGIISEKARTPIWMMLGSEAFS